MTPPLSAADLSELAGSCPPPEEFGPESRYPALVVMLDGTDNLPGDWLRTLPCPVIGIGEGSLAPACDMVVARSEEAAPILRNIAAAPIAAMVLVQHLRASEALDLPSALTAESFAYATVQQGPEFRRLTFPRKPAIAANAPAVEIEVVDDGRALAITLNRPASRNAIDVEMRDALSEALDLALVHPEAPAVHIKATGRCFSTGGEVAEFGLASDPATAHWVRSLRLPARRLARLGDRLSVHVRGAAIGAGLEIAAFASRLTASSDAWFQLPELKYGLIPGAGGTVSVARRIGRQRTAYMALSMKRVSAETALGWGLIDAIVE